MPRLNIFIAGHVCIDRNIIDGIAHSGWGSTAMYISHYLRNKKNTDVSILAPYGKDFINYNDCACFVNAYDDHPTIIYENIVSNGARSQYCRNYENIQLPKINAKAKEKLRSADILIIAPMVNDYPIVYVDNLFKEISKDCLKVLLPQGYMRSIGDGGKVLKREFIEASDILNKIDLLIFSNEDINNSSNLAIKWTQYNDKLLAVVTKAEEGADYAINGVLTSIPTIPIPFNEVMNPVGSGDIFSINLSLTLKQNPNQISKSIRLANLRTGKYLMLAR